MTFYDPLRPLLLLGRGKILVDERLDRIRPDPVTVPVGVQEVRHDLGAERPVGLEKLLSKVQKENLLPVGLTGERRMML